jgi:PHD/YefM family antitoxin component YafN of YafNO toxin-antitoxin module
MAEEKQLKEALAAYGAVAADLKAPVILERDGQPVAVVLSFEEYRRLRDIATTEDQRRQAWWAREEVKEMRRARRGGR